MGIISSIFGERPSAPQTGGFTTGAEIPKELAPYYKDILGKSQALYNDSISQGYQPYTGPSLAEFTPEQQQAFTGLAGLQGSTAPIFQEAMGMTRQAGAPITTEEITEYMNPYQQAVVDVEKREATKQYQSQVVPQLAAQAARIQPFGGSRQAILEGMAADTQQRLLGDIQAKGSAQAYQDSVNLLNQQRMQQGQAAGQLATMGSNQFKSQLGELGALQTIGEEKQQLAQQALNEAYGQYIKEQEYPYQQLGRYQSVVTGAPIQGTTYVPPTPPSPSVGTQLLSGLGTLGATYGAFGGFSPGGFMGANKTASTGGGIGDLPVIKRQQEGSVWSTDPEFGYKVAEKDKKLMELIASKRMQMGNSGKFPFASLANEKNIKSGPNSITQILKDIDNDPELQTTRSTPKIETNYLDEMSDTAFITNLPTDKVSRDARINSPRYKKIMDGLSAIDPEVKELNTEQEISPEVDPAVAIADKKAQNLKELRQQQIDLTKAQTIQKAEKDAPKADKSDIYADATAAEDAYLLALGNRETRIQGDIDKLGVQEREAQFGNLAMMFARLGTKSGPLLSALVESTGEILPAALKTKNEFAKEGRRLATTIEDAKLGELKTIADIKKSRASLKTKAAQQVFDNNIATIKADAEKEKAKAALWKAQHPEVGVVAEPSKNDKENASIYMMSAFATTDAAGKKAITEIIKANSKLSGSPEEVENYITQLSKDPTAKLFVSQALQRAKQIAKKNKTTLSQEDIKKIVGITMADLIKSSPVFEKGDSNMVWRALPDWR